MADTLTESDKEFIRSYVAEAQDEEEKKQRRKECAKQFDVSLPTVSAVTAWTKIREKTSLVSRPIEIKPEEKINLTTKSDENNEGSHANYDNPTKQLWRETWKTFIAKHTLPSEREKMKVLCLPGKKCLEIPLYLDLGFKPQNITGVEGGDDSARMEFHSSAYRYGIKTKLGRLENLLPNDTNIYDVVSLDFTGPISKTCLNIVKMVPLAPKADCQFNTKSLFMINLLAKRETDIQACIDFYASFTRPELTEMLNSGEGMNYDKFKDIFGYVSELADKASGGEKCYDEAELKDKRNISLVFILTSLIASRKRSVESLWANYKIKEVPQKVRDEIDYAGTGAYVLSVMLSELCEYVGKKAIDFLRIGVPQMVEIVSNYKPFLYEMEEYQYISPVNNANAPFLTEMYQFMTPMADYIKARYFIRFIIDAIFWKGLHREEEVFAEVRDKRGNYKHPGSGLQGKDTIGFVDKNGFVISSVTWQRICEVYNDIIHHINKDKATLILNEGQNARIDLNDQIPFDLD